MAKTIVVCGYGPGVSDAVARKFGSEGFSVAIVGRNKERLAAGVAALEKSGVKAAAFPADLADPAAVGTMIAAVKKQLGAITVIHWNPMAASAGDITTADVADLRAVLDTNVTGLVAAVQGALPDLKGQAGAAILVSNGGAAYDTPEMNAMAADYGFMGLSIGKAAQNKTVAVLAEKLRADGIYVGQVVINGSVKGTIFDSGNATLAGSDVADKFWSLYQERKQVSANYP